MSVWNSLDRVVPHPNPWPTPTDTDDLGDLHNALIANYIAQGYSIGDININDAINVAIQLRPDMEPQLRAITQEQYETVLSQVTSIPLNSSQDLLKYITTIIPVTPEDEGTMAEAFGCLDDTTPPILWKEYLDSLIHKTLSFRLTTEQLTNLVGILQILRSSGMFWIS